MLREKSSGSCAAKINNNECVVSKWNYFRSVKVMTIWPCAQLAFFVSGLGRSFFFFFGCRIRTIIFISTYAMFGGNVSAGHNNKEPRIEKSGKNILLLSHFFLCFVVNFSSFTSVFLLLLFLSFRSVSYVTTDGSVVVADKEWSIYLFKRFSTVAWMNVMRRRVPSGWHSVLSYTTLAFVQLCMAHKSKQFFIYRCCPFSSRFFFLCFCSIPAIL